MKDVNDWGLGIVNEKGKNVVVPKMLLPVSSSWLKTIGSERIEVLSEMVSGATEPGAVRICEC